MNTTLHICDPCRKEHNLKAEKGYQSIRPCDLCKKYKDDSSNKPISFVRTTLNNIEMNQVRREYKFTELGSGFTKQGKPY